MKEFDPVWTAANQNVDQHYDVGPLCLIKVLLHARALTLICACPIFKANFSHYNFSNAKLRNF